MAPTYNYLISQREAPFASPQWRQIVSTGRPLIAVIDYTDSNGLEVWRLQGHQTQRHSTYPPFEILGGAAIAP